ncbi:E3 ubiquitin-protein ligase goliath [Anabrus simplex]|uniref:E3 ubiquitin-protein ligase goliath n=1 Tax=Anabrus simplex TaxID=316456 RepID=UPI0034DCD32E
MAVSLHLLVSVLVVSWVHEALAGEWPYSNGSGHHNNNNEEMQGYTNAILNVTYNDSTGFLHTDKREQGRFGRGHVGPSSGVLVHLGRDDAGCSPLQKPQVPPGEPWIALVERGRCVDDTKVEHAWLSNAAAVVIYNVKDSAPLEKMQLYEHRNISGVLIPKQRGEELVRLIENGTRVYLTISVGSFVQKPYTNINRTSVLFVSISFIVLMIISLAWLVFYYVQRFRYIHAKDRLSRRLCSAAKKALSKIPTKNIKSEDKEIQGDGECCAVCIEPYKVSDVLRILPCKHEFHRSCIDPWLLEHRTCPMCKMDILKHYGFVFTGSQESILHMDIEEVFGIGTDEMPDTDSLHRRSISPMPHIRPVDHQVSSPASPELQSHSSRASSPDEMSPSLSSGKRLMRGAESSTDPVPCILVCSSCGSDMATRPETTCDTNACAKSDPCNTEDCEVESCSSSSTGSPHQSRSLGK